MPIYVCDKCNYTTKHRQNITKHLNKINPCSNEKIYVNLDILDDLNLNFLERKIKLYEDSKNIN